MTKTIYENYNIQDTKSVFIKLTAFCDIPAHGVSPNVSE